MTLTFEQARACVLRETSARLALPAIETVSALDSNGRVLAENISSDRDYPPFPRSARDGFAVRAADIPGTLDVIGEVRAGGDFFTGTVGAGQAVEIMTGAPMPNGADAVLMIEHVTRDKNRITTDKSHKSGDNFNARGIAAQEGEQILARGTRLTFTEIAFLATVGRSQVQVYKKPRIAVLPTGDEIVDVSVTPGPHQIRNSNAWSMAAQVARAGGEPAILPIARDNYDSTRALVEQGLQCDMLLLSGGVSAGKYDIVEQVLADLGTEFFFTRVKVQPGQPLVFGHLVFQGTDKLVFGLPGNPASTMVTLEVFARAAIELISGSTDAPLPILEARLTKDFRQKTGLTRFLPALIAPDGLTVEPLSWQGSGDIVGMSRANAFLVTDPDRETWSAGDRMKVLLK